MQPTRTADLCFLWMGTRAPVTPWVPRFQVVLESAAPRQLDSDTVALESLSLGNKGPGPLAGLTELSLSLSSLRFFFWGVGG